MNGYILLAGIVLLLLAAAHSVLGERLIFRHLAPGTPGAVAAQSLLPGRRWLALRATWHLVSILATGLAVCALIVAVPGLAGNNATTVWLVLTLTSAVMGLYWLVATRGGHPAWIGFLLISILIAVGVPIF
jgi:hypothetical protein